MKFIIAALASASLAALGAAAYAQAEDAEAEDEGLPSIVEFTEAFDASDAGLFTFYSDPETGDLFMEVAAEQLGEELIYFTYTENGVPQLGHFRGSFRENRVIQLNRRLGDIEIEAINTSFYFDPENALSRASDANITRAPLALAEIVAEDAETGALLINAGAVLSTEALHQITPSLPDGIPPGAIFTWGGLNEDKTRIENVRSYPENADVIVEYVFDQSRPGNSGGSAVTDARSVAVKVQHSFVAMPEPGYQPRRDDFRVGYFGERITDLTATGFTPYADLIQRWRLEKADPDAEVSDPVEPITWWIENTTPVEIRDAVREGALAWNEVFEAAGISNAIRVEVQPDDAEWDAGDIRYNVLRWTSSPNPPFGGYGPSFTNPRTGEIIGADIMLEWIFVTNRLRQSEIFDTAALPYGFAETEGQPNFAPHLAPAGLCSHAQHLQRELIAGRAALQAQGAPQAEIERFVSQGVKELVLHEIGHTLGLSHNMAASFGSPFETIGDDVPLASSVMDYNAANLLPGGETPTHYFMDRPGPYDVWAIQFGYTPDEAAARAVLERSTEPALIFGNDADDMRAPGRGIDPRVMTGDLTGDPVAWAASRMRLVDETLAVIDDRVLEDGESYQSLLVSYLTLTGQRAGAANVLTRQIGGVYNNRAAVGQPGAETPFVPVPRSRQKEALALLDANLFGPNAFTAEADLVNRLQAQRRLFDAFGSNQDPALHQRAFQIQAGLLRHLLHPSVLTRMTDARRYGGDYTVAEYLADLTAIMFDADIAGEPNTYRQNLQVLYVENLIGAVVDGSYDPVAQSAALQSISDIESRVAPNMTNMFGLNSTREARAHRNHILMLIRAFKG